MWLSYHTVLTGNPYIKPVVILGPAVWTILAVTGLVAGQPSQSAPAVPLPLSSDPHHRLSQYAYSYHTSQLLFVTFISRQYQ
jgi:hypothetical protein